MLELLKAIYWLLKLIQGGGETIQSIRDVLDAQLDLVRSPQSGIYTPNSVTGAEMTLYLETSTTPWFFGGCNMDMTLLAAADTLIIKFYKINTPGGGYVKFSLDATFTYAGVQDPPLKEFNAMTYNVYGLKITGTRLVAGADRAIPCEFFDAKR